jgi:hypothetical protein
VAVTLDRGLCRRLGLLLLLLLALLAQLESLKTKSKTHYDTINLYFINLALACSLAQ